MSTSAADLQTGSLRGSRSSTVLDRGRVYFASDTRRALQTVLGLIWLLDGALQFQSFMYGKGLHLDADRDDGRPAVVADAAA